MQETKIDIYFNLALFNFANRVCLVNGILILGHSIQLGISLVISRSKVIL